MSSAPSTVFVTLCDQSYYKSALLTINDLRTYGNWAHDILLICVGFQPPIQELYALKVRVNIVEHIDHTELWRIWETNPLKPMSDGRHYKKTTQWDKLQVFSESILSQWDRIVFIDAKLRILDSVQYLLDIDYKGKFLAPDDAGCGGRDDGKRFRVQVDISANPIIGKLLNDQFGNIFEERYFLNCIFMFDTHILRGKDSLGIMRKWMLEYPIMACNEMGVMNLYFTFFLKIWRSFSEKTSHNKYLFGWSEIDYSEKPLWNRFVFLKYPVTIK